MADQEVIAYLIKLEDRVSKELDKVSKRADKAEANFKQLSKQQDQQRKASEKQAKALETLKSSFKVAAAAATAAGAAFAAMGLGAIKTSANLEKFETQLSTLLGSVDKGRERVEKLFEISATTPFEIEGLVAMDTKLEAFGVNADRVRGGVMDLAAVTGMELVDAADAVGRAMTGGAGAADMLRDKGVKGWVEVQAGISAADMTLDEWRENLVNTLETNEKIVGGTQELAQTFVGLFSSMKDQWTIFQKQVGDAGAFEASKAMLKDILALLGENKEMTRQWAEGMSRGVVTVLVLILEMIGRIAETYNFFEKATLTWGNGVDALLIKLQAIYRQYLQIVGTAKQLTGTLAEGEGAEIDAKMLQSYKDAGAARERIRVSLEEQLPLLDQEGNKLRDIRRVAEDIQARFDAGEFAPSGGGGGGGGGGSTDIMTGPTMGEGDGAAGATASFEEMVAKLGAEFGKVSTTFVGAAFDSKEAQAFAKEMSAVDVELSKLQKAMKDGSMSSEQLEKATKKMADKYLEAHSAATNLGGAAASHFKAIEEKWQETMNNMRDEIKGMTLGEHIGNLSNEAVGVLQDGGMGMLSAAGPGGAAAAGLIGMGQQGEEEFNRQAEEGAREAAKERQSKMAAEAEAMKKQGFSQDEIEAAGLGRGAIQEAGQVTDEDIKAAEGDLDRGEIMAEQVEAVIQGIIDGVTNIIKGLPEILSTLIPMLLIDLPTALIEAIPELIEELIPVLIFELPAALFKMAIKLIPLVLKNIFVKIPVAIFRGFKKGFVSVWKSIKSFFKSLFSFGIFQTGGYIPKTGMNLLHQGERVVPATGASSQTATKGLQAFTGAPRPNLTVNTNVVDPNSIGALGRLIDDELGAFGRSTVPIFGDNEPTTLI